MLRTARDATRKPEHSAAASACQRGSLRAQVVFLPTSLVAYAALATHNWVDVAPFVASPDPYELPAEV